MVRSVLVMIEEKSLSSEDSLKIHPRQEKEDKRNTLQRLAQAVVNSVVCRWRDALL